jgi:hypothetical protein
LFCFPPRFQEKWADVHNRQLLFHGSSLSNYVGILSQGLRIAPPEAPVSGYAFGKGVYFSDMFQKSFGYCRMATSGTSSQKVPPTINTSQCCFTSCQHQYSITVTIPDALARLRTDGLHAYVRSGFGQNE